MREILATLQVHVARVPFTVKRRNRVHAPMDEDAELCVLIPARDFVLLQRIPVWLIWSLVRLSIHLVQQ